MPGHIDLDQILDIALASYEAGQPDQAEAGYRTVLQHDPNEPDALNLLGLILQERGDIDGSIALITRALDIEPDFPEALTNLAQAQRSAGAPEAAAEAARRAIVLDPKLTAAYVQLGRALIELHDDAGAVDALREATRLAPSSVEALVPLGVALLRLNDPRNADVALTAALALSAGCGNTATNLAPALADLARAYRAAGDAAAAVEAAQRAVTLDPALLDARVQLGQALLLQCDYVGAVDVLRRATAMTPTSLEAQTALATASIRRKDHRSAAEAWRAALALKPDDVGLIIELAASLGELGRFDDALATYRQADSLAPGHPPAQYGIAVSLMYAGDIAAATEACQRALEATPDWSRLWLVLGNCEAMLGHFPAAIKAYRRTLALEPGLADALYALAALGEGFDDGKAKGTAQEVLDDPSRPIRDRVAAGFALGRECERNGAYDQAFAAYAHANRRLRADRIGQGFVFDRHKFRDLVDRQIAAIDPRAFADTAGWGDPSDLPVFIVGMPRSGTSLVEQIAASHKLVVGAGELNGIPGIVTALGAARQTGHPTAWDRASVRRETTAYVQRLRGLGHDAIRIIDKQFDNILCLGQLAVLFPRARIVMCRRDLRDVGLSCFFQYFRDDAMVWTDDLADCGFRAREIERLVQHWRTVLPLSVLEIQYETLVGNLESESRRLISFLGLEWDPACLSFHETERIVLTASQWQVRQPLYASSVGRWRHYRHHLEPLLQELEGLVLADDEDATQVG